MAELDLTIRPLSEDVSANDTIDLRGELCPYTFVKSKLALEDMEVGDVLGIVLDHLPAVDNCPRSFTNEGQEILGVEQQDETDWVVTVRKVRD